MGEDIGDSSLVLQTYIFGRGTESNNSVVDWFLRQSGPVRHFRCGVFTGLPVSEIARVLESRVLPHREPLTGLFHLLATPITKYALLNLMRSAWSLDHAWIEPDDSVVIDRNLGSTLLRKTISYAPAAWENLVAHMQWFYGALDESSSS